MEATQVSIDRRMDKQDVHTYIHTMEYYSTLKGREILTRAAVWMGLEDVVLGEISQSQNGKYCMIPLI